MASALSSPRRDGSSPQRERILDAALGILTDDGAAGLTVRSIADAAGCSTTGIYTWFGGKHGLVEALFRQGFASFGEALAPTYEAGDLMAAGRTYRRWALDHRTHYLVMFGRAVPDFEPGVDALAEAAATFAGLVDLVADILGPTATERQAADWAYHANATVHGYVMTEITGLTQAPADDLDALYELGLAAVLTALESARLESLGTV